MSPSRVALGTAQFGLDYGVANTSGQITEDEGRTILSRAREHGMDTIDTAAAYGSSEVRLGEIGVAGWRVVSKLPVARPDAPEAIGAWVREHLHRSLERLKVTRLSGLLLHRSDHLLGEAGQAVATALREARDDGLVEKVGYSVYAPSELEASWKTLVPDLIQAPFNVVDRRLETTRWLSRLKDAGVEVHVRSTFLQGLLLLPKPRRPRWTEQWSFWPEWDSWLKASGIGPLQACLAFVLSHPEIDRVVVGVDNANQLSDILETASRAAPQPPAGIASEDSRIVDPSKWPREMDRSSA